MDEEFADNSVIGSPEWKRSADDGEIDPEVDSRLFGDGEQEGGGLAVHSLSGKERNHLFLNDGDGALTERSLDLGPGMQLIKVGRGSAIGDVDHDGDLDVMITNNVDRADYLRNEGGATAGSWIQLRLIGVQANRAAVGARVTVRTEADPPQIREVVAGSSYCSVSDPRLHVGLGAAAQADIEIRWPGGAVERIEGLASGRLYLVREGAGVVASRGPLGR